MEKVTANQAAKLLGISVDKLEILEKQGLIHSTVNTEGARSYSAEEIARIKSRRNPTLAEEAAQVGTEIQQEVFTSVSGLVKLRKKASIFGAGLLAVFILSLLVITVLFYKYPLATSDYFGYYYRFNSARQKISLSSEKEGNVLAASTGPVVVSTQTSVLADIIKPIAAVSLVAVKAVDNQKYTQIVTNPVEASALSAPTGTGSPANNGTNGANGADGQPGTAGPQGVAGLNGTNGTNGSNGVNGTSVPISGLTAANLTAGDFSSKITSGTYSIDITGSVASATNFTGLLAGDVTGTQGSTVLKNTGTAGSYGSGSSIPVFTTDAQGRVSGVTNTAISGLTVSNFGSANISQWTNDLGYIIPSSTDTLTNKSISGSTNTFSNIPNSALTNSALTVSAGTGLTSGGLVSLGGTVTLSLPSVGTAGTYGSATTIPIITTDAQGRVSGVTATGISGLTAANLTAGDFSSKVSSGTYSIDISGNAATATTATSANSATTATNFSGSLTGDVTGTQGSTNVAKINGAVLGTTTATSGNLLIGSGTQWVTQALSNDATINSSGALTLKNTGTAGTYGSALSIPVLTTDAQGRVLGVSNTTISGLTNSNLSGSAGITNANLANSSISFSTGTAGSDFNISGTPSLGGTLTLNIPSASASNRGLLTSTDWSTFNGKQNALGYTPLNSTSNLSDLASASTARTNLGLGTLAIQSGTFSGTSSGTNTGDQTISLTGDVTGSGTSSFATTLKNVGVAGSYGSATQIPVLTTDAQGRVSGVTNTTISGLTVSSFGSANISQWTNNSGFITGSTTDTLTNKTISGSTNTLSNIANSSLSNSGLTFAGNTGSGGVSLGGTLTISGSGINTAAYSGGTITVTGTEADTLATVTGRGATTATALTLSNISNAISAGTLTVTGGTINGTTIGATSPSTGVFTTINGLTITNNGTNTLNIAAGKSLIVNNSITFGGTDGTSFTLPSSSDTLVGRSSTDTLTNKTIAAGSNTITGLTNSNLSGSAGITNANLANSSITTVGNSGSGSVSLGGGLTFTGGGITNIVASGSTLTVTSTEADTLQSVYNRGNTIPTTTGSTANTIDSATINVGNIASTAQQNFSTLNITNGGTGYLDIELIKGFINFQGMNTLYDDFTDRVLNTTNRWTATASGGGSSCSILAGGLNGLLRMIAGTGGANRACELTTQAVATLTNGFYQRGNNPIFETKVTLNSLTSDIAYAGFTDTRVTLGSNTNASTNHAYFAKRSTDTNWQCVTDNGGVTETYTDTGVAVSTGVAYRLRIELRNGTTPETICTVDDGTTVTRKAVTATQPGATSPMDIYLAVVVTANTTAKNMDVDYVRAWQDDPVPGLAVDNNSQQPSVEGSVNVASIDATSSATLPLEEKVASDSGNLVKLVADSVNNLFKNLVEFFGNVIFHANVSFLGRATFNSDTGGFAVINAGALEVTVNFDKEYQNIPVVIGSPDTAVLYSITDVSTKGFKIKLTQIEKHDIKFSWTATAVKDAKTSVGTAPTPTPEAGMPAPTEIPTVSPSSTPSVMSTDIPSITPSGTTSPSTEPLP